MKPTGWGEAQHCSATDKRMSVNKNIKFAERAENWDWRENNGVSPVKN